MRKLLPLLAVVAVLCGCGRNNGPAVNLVTVHLREVSAFETTSEFIVRLSNDGPEARRFTGSAHKIYINGLYVGKGLSAETIEVPRLGSVTQAITVHLNNLMLATRVKAVIEAKKFEYKVQSTFFGDSLFNRMRSETEGKLDLKDFTPTELETNAVPEEASLVPPPPPEEPGDAPAAAPEVTEPVAPPPPQP